MLMGAKAAFAHRKESIPSCCTIQKRVQTDFVRSRAQLNAYYVTGESDDARRWQVFVGVLMRAVLALLTRLSLAKNDCMCSDCCSFVAYVTSLKVVVAKVIVNAVSVER